MGGVEITAVKCADYNSGNWVDKDVRKYLDEGFKVVNDDMVTWGWFWFAIWWLYGSYSDYLNTIREIILCAISNETGGVYGTEEYLKEVFDPAVEEMQPSFDMMAFVWHPALATLYLFVPWGWLWLLLLNIIVMFDYGDYFAGMYQRLRGGGGSGGPELPPN